MGKDKKGHFHPPKGKPSGPLRENTSIPEDVNDAHIMHPNRNVNKDEGDYIEKSGTASYKSKLHYHRTPPHTDKPATVEEIVGPVTKEMILSLSGYRADNCISIYLPTHKAGKEVNEKEDAIVFKTLFQEAAAELKKKGMDDEYVDKLLSPANSLLQNDLFWANLSGGLAVFIADGLFRYLKVPAAVNKKVVINHSFQISPLIPFIKGQYFILALSNDDAILYRADEFEIEAVLTTELKREVIAFGDVKDGFGEEGKDDIGGTWSIEERPLAIYFKEIDFIIQQQTGYYDNVPLVLAGTQYLTSIYRRISTYPIIWPDEINGQVFNDSAESIHQKSLDVIADYFIVPVEEALHAYANNSATGLTSSIPEDVVKAAYEGRISQLFIEKEAEINGIFSEEKFEAEIHDDKQEKDEDLIEKIVLKTILTDGDVHFLPKEEMPSESSVAALMRF
jgi:hypothetical protein